MAETQKNDPNKEVNKKKGTKVALAAGSLAAAIAVGTGGIHLAEEYRHAQETKETAEQTFEQNRESIEDAYNTIEVGDIFNTRIADVQIGESVSSTAGGDALNAEGLVPSAVITIEYEDGDRAEEFMEPLPVGENDTSELLWGPYYELKVENYFLDENGQRTGLVLPSYMLESDGGQMSPNSIGMQTGGGKTTMIMPFNSYGTREAHFYEVLDVSVASTIEEDRRTQRSLEKPLGVMTFSVTEDGVEVVDPFEPIETTTE